MTQKNTLAIKDYLDIQNLYALYNLSSDEEDSATNAYCFTDDWVLAAPTKGIGVSSLL